jgi:hypothetical protein
MSRIIANLKLGFCGFLFMSASGCAMEEASETQSSLSDPQIVATEGHENDPPDGPGTCQDYWYYTTTTSRVDRPDVTFCGFNIIGQYATCRRYYRCTQVNTYMVYTHCDPPVTTQSLISSEITSCSYPYDDCPVPFFQRPC